MRKFEEKEIGKYRAKDKKGSCKKMVTLPLTYDSESWTLTNSQESLLNAGK